MERLATLEIQHPSMSVTPVHFIQKHMLQSALNRLACFPAPEANFFAVKYDGDKDLHLMLYYSLLPASTAEFRLLFDSILYFKRLGPSFKLEYFHLSTLLESILAYLRDVSSFHRFLTQICVTIALDFIPPMKRGKD
jgi:hypothetical protein